MVKNNKSVGVYWVFFVALPIAIITALLIAVSYDSRISRIEADSLGEYDYCIEWDGWINIHNLDYKCRVLPDGVIIICNYVIAENNDLTVTFYNTSLETESKVAGVELYKCSKLVKSIDAPILENMTKT